MMPRWPGAVSASCLAVVMVCLAAPATARQLPEVHAYVLLAESSSGGSSGTLKGLARVIIAATDHPCPTLSPGLRAMTLRTNPNPTTFPVTVCEAVYPFGRALTVDGLGIKLPEIGREQPKRIIVIGDTGCLNDSDQDCATEWPFPAFAKAAAKGHPDLVIHVGDYNYRGTPSKVNGVDVYDGCAATSYVSQNPQNDLASTSWDRWETWRDDFFRPAAPCSGTRRGSSRGGITSSAAARARGTSTSWTRTRFCSATTPRTTGAPTR